MAAVKKVTLTTQEAAYGAKVSPSQISAWAKDDDSPLQSLGQDVTKRGKPVHFDLQAFIGWLLAKRLRERLSTGKGNETANVIDFHQEKTRLTKAQADSKELDNLVKLGKLAEISILAETLSNTLGMISARLDSIPAELRRKCPHLDQATLDEIVTIITGIRNSIEGDAVALPDAVSSATGLAE